VKHRKKSHEARAARKGDFSSSPAAPSGAERSPGPGSTRDTNSVEIISPRKYRAISNRQRVEMATDSLTEQRPEAEDFLARRRRHHFQLAGGRIGQAAMSSTARGQSPRRRGTAVMEGKTSKGDRQWEWSSIWSHPWRSRQLAGNSVRPSDPPRENRLQAAFVARDMTSNGHGASSTDDAGNGTDRRDSGRSEHSVGWDLQLGEPHGR
jgi:hypothetical protein